jgi:hypothetical protein
MRLNALAIMPSDEIGVGEGVGVSAETINRNHFAVQLPSLVIIRLEVMCDEVTILEKTC